MSSTGFVTSHAPEETGVTKSPAGTCARDVFFGTAASFGAIWGVLQSLDAFLEVSLVAGRGLWAWYVLLLHSLLLGMGYALVRLLIRLRHLRQEPRRLEEVATDERLSDALVRSVSSHHKMGQHAEVVRLASVLSRPLWVSGRYRERIAIGGFSEDSAARIGDKRQQASALIDDLGWTNAVLGNLSQASKNIEHGVELAQSLDDAYLEAKGLRHLGMIQQKFLARPLPAQALLERAEHVAERIKDDRARDEMMAGILFNRGEGFLQLLEFENARQYAGRALGVYSQLDDHTRRIKVMTLIAHTHLAAGDLAEAKDGFRSALAAAQRHVRRDEVGKSLLGLGEAYLREGSFEMAESTLTEALETLREIGLKKELAKAEDYLRRARNRDTV